MEEVALFTFTIYIVSSTHSDILLLVKVAKTYWNHSKIYPTVQQSNSFSFILLIIGHIAFSSSSHPLFLYLIFWLLSQQNYLRLVFDKKIAIWYFFFDFL
jgi:hypothetical protein